MTRKTKIRFTLIVPLLTFIGWGNLYAGEKKLDGKTMLVKDFLKMVRRPVYPNAWVIMTGTVEHKSTEKFKIPIQLRYRLQKASLTGQIILGEVHRSHERWLIRQIPADGLHGVTAVQQEKPKDGVPTLADLMIRPRDLAFGFLYWKFVKELKPDRLSGHYCRVLELQEKGGESVRVWVSTKAFSVAKAQWFRPKAQEFYRQLEIRGLYTIKSTLNKGNKFDVPHEIRIRNKGWATLIRCKDVKGDEVDDENPPPKDLFVPSGKK